MGRPSPLLGYNTNVRHKGKLYHIQTEDSGVNHPHIITHLFADGGRIIATRKTGYSDHVGADDYQSIVKKLMQEQHKAMFIALRDGAYDEPEGATDEAVSADIDATDRPPRIDVDALEAAAARFSNPGLVAPTSQGPVRESLSAGRYQSTQPTAPDVEARSRPPESIFGSDLLSEKSLDEVILSYLAEDLQDADD